MKAQITLTPAESKRLIAKALLNHPKIKRTRSSGVIVINLGSTNAFVAEELLKKEISKERFVAGMIDGKGACVVPRNERLTSIVIRDGKVSDENPEKVTRTMGPDDVFVKGANAVDKNGVAWVMLASETGGTVGHVIGTLMARGVPIIIPVGMEKFVPDSLNKAASKTGIYQVDYSTGSPIGIIPVNGEVVTEKEAFRLMGNVEVYVIGAGGIGGGEGSYTFLIEGDEGVVKDIFDRVKEIKGEKNIESIRGSCSTCIYICPERK
jgi:hypothetical protein